MRQTFLKIASIYVILILPLAAFAENGTISGIVYDINTGEPLVGANIYIIGTALGIATNEYGYYEIRNITPGIHNVKVSYMGYKISTIEIEVKEDVDLSLDFLLEEEVKLGAEISILADRARPGETPVAFTNVDEQVMDERLGSQDIPLVLNASPSVYATMQGGGTGDARVNVRGFNQQNIAIMVNGVPVNDLENGLLLWSNWDGLGDATSSIQIQRGLSAVNLATPSIGGLMSIITNPTALNHGFRFKQEVGSDGFVKSTFNASSGTIEGKYAVNGTLVRKVGDGLVDKTWTDSWAYYFGASYQMNDNNRFELYAIGAPQVHGQNRDKQNIAVYSDNFARSLIDYDRDALDQFHEAGRTFNQNWGKVSSSYSGKQYWNGKIHDRYAAGFINVSENYSHKPLVNLNWFSNLKDDLTLFSTLYYSGGTVGSSGLYGSVQQNSIGIPAWNTTIETNEMSREGSLGILSNAVDEQMVVGVISKANYRLNDEVRITAGIDFRTAEIDHFREVRDLLGGDYYVDLNTDGTSRSDFWTNAQTQRKLGDKIDYNFTNNVDWLGCFGQSEYSHGAVNAYGMAGFTTVKYAYENHFRKTSTGTTLTSESDWMAGFQIKGGTRYRINESFDVFSNLGYVSKVPIFDNVINDRSGTIATNPQNEKFTSIEMGVNYLILSDKLNTKLNFYYTTWKDRANSRTVINKDGTERIIFLTGMNSVHRGIEFEAGYQITDIFRLDAATSLGNWKYTDNVIGVYKDYSDPQNPNITEKYYVKDLKIGNAPQGQIVLAASITPTEGLVSQLVARAYTYHFSDWDPFSRTNPKDRAQSWEAPEYGIIDFHVSYLLPFNYRGLGLKINAHVFNLMDTEYIQDAVDQSRFNAYEVNGKNHSADDAEVFFGIPRIFNLGLTLTY